MNSFIIVIVVLIALIAVVALIYFSSLTKLKDYKARMDKAESVIETNINKKLDLIISVNVEVKKVTGKKDYLKDYIAIKDLIVTPNEKDFKLDEAERLINNLTNDYADLRNDKEFIKKMQQLREIDEILVAAKNAFNQNAMKSNQMIKSFPDNIVAKIAGYKIRSFYSNNKADGEETF